MYDLFENKSFVGVVEFVVLGLALLTFFGVLTGAVKTKKLDRFNRYTLLISGVISALMLWLLLC